MMQNKTTIIPIVDSKQPLAELRAKIDDIDHRILDLIAQRMDIVTNVAAQKIQYGLVFRARREIEKIRMLEDTAAQLKVPTAMIFDIWRIIMSNASFKQRPFRIICVGASHLAEVALAHFGRDIPLSLTTDVAWALDQQQAAPTEVMCLIDKQRTDWWTLSNQQHNHASIVAELPWRTDTIPTCYLLAHCPIDLEANAEILVAVHASNASWAEIAEIFSLPITSKRQDSDTNKWLIRLQDDAAHNDLETMLRHIHRPPPKDWQVQLLGRFPRFHHRQAGA